MVVIMSSFLGKVRNSSMTVSAVYHSHQFCYIRSIVSIFLWTGGNTNQWYLIQFKPNSHLLAERNLHRQGFETFLPMQKITRRKTSRFVSDLKPLFPGYMFVSVNSDLAPWRTINSTIGVSKLVSFEGKPKPLPLQLISGLMLRCDVSGTLLPPKSLSEGDSVEMLTGPFANFIATVDTIDPEQRIWVLMDFMGQKTRMQISADELQIVK
jgi:transcriptional antiterminator RfaH